MSYNHSNYNLDYDQSREQYNYNYSQNLNSINYNTQSTHASNNSCSTYYQNIDSIIKNFFSKYSEKIEVHINNKIVNKFNTDFQLEITSILNKLSQKVVQATEKIDKNNTKIISNNNTFNSYLEYISNITNKIQIAEDKLNKLSIYGIDNNSKNNSNFNKSFLEIKHLLQYSVDPISNLSSCFDKFVNKIDMINNNNNNNNVSKNKELLKELVLLDTAIDNLSIIKEDNKKNNLLKVRDFNKTFFNNISNKLSEDCKEVDKKLLNNNIQTFDYKTFIDISNINKQINDKINKCNDLFIINKNNILKKSCVDSFTIYTSKIKNNEIININYTNKFYINKQKKANKYFVESSDDE